MTKEIEPRSMNVGVELLHHVIANDCTDADCEIHNIDVGMEEQVLDNVSLAFYLAGAQWMYNQVLNAMEDGAESTLVEFRKQFERYSETYEPLVIKLDREVE